MMRSKLEFTILTAISLLALALPAAANTSDPNQNTNNTNTQTADDGATLTFTQAKADEIQSNRVTACEGIDLEVKFYTDSEMETKREENSNSFVQTVDLLLEVYQNGDYMKLLDVKLIFMMIIVIFLVLVIISMIIFYVNICLCCCDGNEKNRNCCISCNLVFASIGLLGFAACCAMITFYISGVKTGMSEVNCSLNRISDDVINGNDSLEKFLGFFKISGIINNYLIDFQKLIDNHVQKFSDIRNMGLASIAQTAYDSIDVFVQSFEDRKTHDADGGSTKTPLSISQSLPALQTAAQEEFKTTRDVCQQVHDAADIGFKQTNNADVQGIKDSLKSVVLLVDGFSNIIYDSFGTISTSYNSMQNYYDIGQLSFIIFSFVCLAIGIVIYVSLCCALKKNKCSKFCCCRLFVAILGTLTFLFVIISFVMGAVTFGTSASCGLLQQFTDKDGISKFVDLFQLDSQMQSILETCLLESGSGKLNSIFPTDPNASFSSSDTFAQIESLLSVFDQYQTQIDSLDPDNNSLVLKSFNDVFTKIKTGEVPDHVNIGEGLNLINSAVSCSDEVYVFSAGLCPATGTCKVIETVNSYQAPACQTDSTKNQEASNMLNKLKVYYPETVQLMTELIDNSYETTNNTPNKKYKTVLTQFRSAVTSFDLIKVDLENTLNSMQNNTIQEGANCKIIRAEFQSLEHALCFKFVPNMYNFMLVALIGSVLFFSFIWHFCCATFCLERSGKHGEAAEFNEKIENDVFRPTYGKKNKYSYFEN